MQNIQLAKPRDLYALHHVIVETSLDFKAHSPFNLVRPFLSTLNVAHLS